MQDLKHELDSFLTYITENTLHWIYRCPFCGDSSDEKKGHLYVSKTMPVYRCARCGASGHYNSLAKLFNKEFELPESMRNFVIPKLSKYDAKFNFVIDDLAEDYLKQRLDCDVDPEECKLVSSKNLKEIYKRSPNYKDCELPSECVSFVTYYNKKIVCRNFGKDEETFERYKTIKLSEGSDVYVLNNKRRVENFRKHKTIVIAEGIFDILNTFYNVKLFPKDAIYAAALNSNMAVAAKITKIISQCFFPNLIILADADKPDLQYIREIKESFKKIDVYRNEVGKDFGEKIVVPILSRKG